MKQCLVCNAAIEPFLSFGRMPLGNGFLSPAEFSTEYFYELEVAFCAACRMVQLTQQVDRERMFHDEYAYYSSTSSRMVRHFQQFAEYVRHAALTTEDPFVVEIGSNDGILLQNFVESGVRHLGLEPSANVARVAVDRGIRTDGRFFEEEAARQIVALDGQADAIIGANVICHIPYLHSVMAGVKHLLKPDGLFIFEDPYLGDIIEKTSYDQIYDEHSFYFSVSSVSRLAERFDLELIDALPQSVHGGSMRYVLTHRGSGRRSASVEALLAKEEELGLHSAETYETFRHNVEDSRDRLMALLDRLRSEGSRVVGYGATSKSTTVINYCGMTSNQVEYISDTTPIKQGKLSPGAHIPVRPYAEFVANYPDYALLFAWNHAAEIMEKEQAFKESGGRWVVFVPAVEVLT